MRPSILLAVPALLIFSGCAQSLHRSAPAEPDALLCAGARLQSLGYAVSSARGAVVAERTVEREWVYRVDHRIDAALDGKGSRLLLTGFRRETRTPGTDQPSTAGRVLQPTHRRLPADPALEAVLEQVVQACGTPAADLDGVSSGPLARPE